MLTWTETCKCQQKIFARVKPLSVVVKLWCQTHDPVRYPSPLKKKTVIFGANFATPMKRVDSFPDQTLIIGDGSHYF